MTPENHKDAPNPKPTEEEKIIYALSGFCIPPNVKKAIKQSLDYISAQRQAWEKEKAGLEYLVEHEKRRADNIHGRRIAELEERVKYLEAEKSNLKDALETAETQHGVETEATDYIFKRCDELRAENYRLKAENEGYPGIAKDLEDSRETISRLSASLAAAREALDKIHKMPESSGCGDEQRIAQEALSDPTGQAAHERWKKMEAIIESLKKFKVKFDAFLRYQNQHLSKGLEAAEKNWAEVSDSSMLDFKDLFNALEALNGANGASHEES